MSKEAKFISFVMILLMLSVGVFAYFNRGDVAYKEYLQEESIFEITVDDHKHLVDMEYLIDLKPVDIVANLDTSTTEPTDIFLKGVELKVIFDSFDIDYSNIDSVVFKSLDGYSSAITYDELIQEDNIYICFSLDDKPLLTKAQGGMGPYLMIIQSSKFSQRWCKYIQEIYLQ